MHECASLETNALQHDYHYFISISFFCIIKIIKRKKIMKLSDKELTLFNDLMTSLQFYVNEQFNIIPQIKTIDDYKDYPTYDKFEVRKALYNDISIIDTYINENPQNFSKSKLSMIEDWKGFIEGDFYIERFLKKYTIFIKDDKVYGVFGLQHAFKDLIQADHLPLCVKTVLLPFNGKIIFDGIFQGYTIAHGGGIRTKLRNSYLNAKQKGQILTSFRSSTRAVQNKINEDDKPLVVDTQLFDLINDMREQANKLNKTPEMLSIYNPAFRLIKASLEFAERTISNPLDKTGHYKLLKKIERALTKGFKVVDLNI